MNDPLPDKLSELIELAVNDARKLDRNKYVPYFGEYHEVDLIAEPKICYICDAGAVIAGTLQADPHVHVAAYDYTPNVGNKLKALDLARTGHYRQALAYLGMTDVGILTVPRSRYFAYRNWEEFDKHLLQMKDVAQQLKALGY